MFMNTFLEMSQKIVDGLYFFANSQICMMRDLFSY